MKLSNRFTAYSSNPIEMKLDSMILDISPLDRFASNCSIFSRGAWGTRLLKNSNRFTAYSSYPIKLKLGRMALDISPLDRSEPNFSISFQGAVGARLLQFTTRFTAYISFKFSNRFTTYSIYPLDLELDMIIPSYRSAQSV